MAVLAVCLMTAGTALTSCDDYLTDDSQSHITPENAYGSVSDLKKNALLNIYNYIGGNKTGEGLQGTERGVYDLNSFTTDEQIAPIRSSDWYDGGLWRDLFTHNWSAGLAPLKNSWDYLYKVIISCNDGIKHIDAFKTDNVDEKKELNSYKSELRAIRAMYYFYLMDLFGRVAKVDTTTVKSSELKLEKRSDLFFWIYNELSESMPGLAQAKSAINNTEYYGRMTQDVAYFVMMKLAINAEIYADDDWTDDVHPDGSKIILPTYNILTSQNDNLNAWEAVNEIADKLSLAAYDLSKSYNSNFEEGNEVTHEKIFVIPMDSKLYSNKCTYFFRSRHYRHGDALGEGGENGPCATVSTMKTFGYDYDGDPDFDGRFSANFYAGEVMARHNTVYEDDGKTILYYHPLEVTSIDLSGNKYEKTAGARYAKYSSLSSRSDGHWENNDIVLFRFADVLLMSAEANYRLGNTQEALKLVNRVYYRANNEENYYKEINDDVLLNERLKEFMWEGWRRNDLIRFGRFHKAYDLKTEEYAEKEKDGHTIVFPIPADLMAMHPDWKQNPGY